jgi:hypothetical protein
MENLIEALRDSLWQGIGGIAAVISLILYLIVERRNLLQDSTVAAGSSNALTSLSDQIKKSLWVFPIALTGIFVVAIQFSQLWRGDSRPITWIVLILGYMALIVALGHIAFKTYL